MVLMVVATVTVVVMALVFRVNRIHEAAKTDERHVRDAHQQDGDAGRPPRQVRQVGVDLVHFRVVLLVVELEFDLFLLFLVRTQQRKLFGGRVVVARSFVVGLVGEVVIGRRFGVLFCYPFVVQFLFVPVSMLDVGNTHAHGGEGKDTDGEEHATVKHGAHPDAVLDVRFSAAHSSAPLASADHSFSLREGPSCL